MMDKRLQLLTVLTTGSILLAGCKPKPNTPTPTPPAPTPPPAEQPAPSEPEQNAGDDHGMMMKTAALSEGCEVLSQKSAEEKAAIIDDIAHNMDKNALDHILGTECAFAGPSVEIADLTTEDLKLMPNDNEKLWYLPEVNRYVASCSSMNTVGYALKMKDPTAEPVTYFAENRGEFVAAVDSVKKMMEEMGMDHDMDDMDHKDMDDMKDDMDDMKDMKDGEYTGYTEGVVGNGQASLLFFHASWCPTCVQKDKVLTGLYEGESFARSAYKVDYDTASDLKAKYGVVMQDTFVLVDGAGNKIETVSGASEAQLRDFLTRDV